jgi:sec-independent protein translocase protein TatA
MPFNLGGPELFIILAIVLIIFGAGRLPSVMRDVGVGMREFRKAQTEDPPAPPA